MKSSRNDVYLTPEEIASILKISYGTALNFIKWSGIAFCRLGRLYRVNEKDFYEFINKNKPVIWYEN